MNGLREERIETAACGSERGSSDLVSWWQKLWKDLIMRQNMGVVGRPIRSFEDLIVWQKAHQLFLEVVRDIDLFPDGRTSNVIANQVLTSASSY
jgi:four helix bundle protein